MWNGVNNLGVRLLDDDDDCPQPSPPVSTGKQIGIAVAIAGLSAVVTQGVEWAFAELRERFGTKPPPPKKDGES